MYVESSGATARQQLNDDMMNTGSNNSELIDFFFAESSDHLQTIDDDLLALEQQNDDLSRIDRLFRAVHGIKGSAGMLGFAVISQLAHRIENLLGEIRDRQRNVSEPLIDFLFQSVDMLRQQIDLLANGGREDQSILLTFETLFAECLEKDAAREAPAATETARANHPAHIALARAEEYIRKNQFENAIVLYHHLLNTHPSDKMVQQRLEEARALQAYVKHLRRDV